MCVSQSIGRSRFNGIACVNLDPNFKTRNQSINESIYVEIACEFLIPPCVRRVALHGPEGPTKHFARQRLLSTARCFKLNINMMGALDRP